MPVQDAPQSPTSKREPRKILEKDDRKLRNKVPERVKSEKILIKISEKILLLFQSFNTADSLTPLPSSLLNKPRSLKDKEAVRKLSSKFLGSQRGSAKPKPQDPPINTQIFIRELIKDASTSPAQAPSAKPKNTVEPESKPQHKPNKTGRNLRKRKSPKKPEENPSSAPVKKIWLQRLKLFLVPAIAALIGVVLILYPVVATRHNNAHQRRILENYRVNLEANNATELENALKRADEYNRNLAEGKITDPFLVDIIPDSYEYQSYLQQLNVSEILGQIVIPSIRANLPIYHGTEDHTLQKGVGHLFGSSLPVGGKDTHSILTGHSGLASATMFDNLHKVKKGDKIFLNVSGRNMQYGVTEIKVVLPDETDSLVRQPGKDLLTLITCTPYGINSHRLFVTAEREHPVDKKELNKELKQTAPPWETWMIVLIVIAVSGGGLISAMLIHSFLAYRKRKEEAEEQQDTDAEKDAAPTTLNVADTDDLRR